MNADNKVLISVSDLKKHYNMGAIKALDGITTDIRKGEVVVIIGPSGSGKSTFLRSLNLLERPTGGTIMFEGVDITSPKTDINLLRRNADQCGSVSIRFSNPTFPLISFMPHVISG